MIDQQLLDEAQAFCQSATQVCREFANENLKGALLTQIVNGANNICTSLQQAAQANGKTELRNRLQTTLKFCFEVEYLLQYTTKFNKLDVSQSAPLVEQCGAIRKTILCIINTAKD